MKMLKKSLSWVIMLLFVALGFLTVSKSQDIIDWWKLRDYTPSETISSIASNSGLNAKGKKLFYVNNPLLLDKKTFGASCDVGEQTIVLGCYVKNKGIFIYDITDDQKLKGVEEVTATHEMLHSAYDRLSPSEKDRVNKMLDDAYSRVTNQRVIDNVTSYKNRDPSVVPNELHSILGTEIKDLPKDLEVYYSQYFTDRQKVVQLSENYAEEFEKLEVQIKNYDAQLSTLNGDITRLQADLGVQNESLVNEKSKIESLRSDPTAFNKSVVAYNKKVSAYNSDVERVKGLVDQYNNLVTERNKIAIQEKELVEAIDTRQVEL